MKTPLCRIGDDGRIWLSKAGRAAMHRKCDGAYRTTEGELQPCACDCHGGVEVREVDFAGKALPVLAEPPAAGPPDPSPKGPGKPTKRATGACEHCGAPTGGRFAPGHDAKLKSELGRAAMSGGPTGADAWAELLLRDWARLVKTQVHADARRGGQAIADREGYRFVEQRVKERQGHG